MNPICKDGIRFLYLLMEDTHNCRQGLSDSGFPGEQCDFRQAARSVTIYHEKCK